MLLRRRCRPAIWEGRNCAGVAIKGVSLQNAPWRAVHAWNCSGVLVAGATLLGGAGREGDQGLVLDSSRHVSVTDTAISTGGGTLRCASWTQFGVVLDSQPAFRCL